MFRSKYKIIKKSGLFDEKFYLKTYEDVRKAEVDPIKHYIKHGWKEGRNPSSSFDTNYYLEQNPDVKEAGVNPLLHAIMHGNIGKIKLDLIGKIKKFELTTTHCPICGQESSFYINIKNYNYYNCNKCDFIFIEPDTLKDIDMGGGIVKYEKNYWDAEIESAKLRSRDDNVARLCELIYYARIPINTLVDISTGPGYLLDFIEQNMQNLAVKTHGIEKYPPPVEYRTHNKNYFIGEIGDFHTKIDAGLCIETLEHLTPKMFDNMLQQISLKANKGSIFLFNTGLSTMVKNGGNNYLDPTVRGHIVSWSIEAVKLLAKKYNFTIHPIRGKNFAFVMEFECDRKINEDITDRIWTPLEENMKLLESDNLGNLLKTFGRESVRGFLC